jgi:hypothetical protein
MSIRSPRNWAPTSMRRTVGPLPSPGRSSLTPASRNLVPPATWLTDSVPLSSRLSGIRPCNRLLRPHSAQAGTTMPIHIPSICLCGVAACEPAWSPRTGGAGCPWSAVAPAGTVCLDAAGLPERTTFGAQPRDLPEAPVTWTNRSWPPADECWVTTTPTPEGR